MVLFKKLFFIITLLLVLAAHFPLSSWAASSDIDIDYTQEAVTIFDIENYIKRRQDTYFNFIYRKNYTLFNIIKNQFLNGYFPYIATTRSSSNPNYIKFRIYFYLIDNNATLKTYVFGDSFIPNDIYDNQGVETSQEIGSYYSSYVDSTYGSRLEFETTINQAGTSDDYTWVSSSSAVLMPTCLVGYISDFFLKLVDESQDYNAKLNTINSNLSSLITNSATIISKLDNIKGAIDNGTNTISSTITSAHNSDNNNNNKNTNEIIDAIKENTNSLSDIQVTNDNSDIINAINNGFSGLNSNNNLNTNQIVSTINNTSEDLENAINFSTNSINNNNNNNTNSIINASNNNTNTIVSNDDYNSNTITEAIEGISVNGSININSNTIDNAVSSINQNNNANTNRILEDSTTEEDTQTLYDELTTPVLEDPLPDLSTPLSDFANNLTSSNSSSKTFNFNIHGKNYSVTLYYNTIYEKLFKDNPVLYTLWQSFWWFLIGMFIYRKCKIIFNELTAGEWDEIFTKTDIHDDIIDGSLK